MSTFKIVPYRGVSVYNGSDELYHIIPSGIEDSYIVVDGGPHDGGKVQFMNAAELKERFGLEIVKAKINKK